MITLQTSGSTGEPKTFDVSDEHLNRRVERLASCKGPEFNSLRSLFMDVRRDSTTFHRNALWCMRNDVELHLPRVSFDRTIDMLNECTPEGIITSPGSLMLYARAARPGPLAHRFRYIQSTGAILTPDNCRAVRAALLADGGALYSGYGASEVGSIALADAEQIEAEHGCVGFVLPDVELELVERGRVRVRTPTMIESRVAADGWFYPGDRGRFRADGMLVLTGRA